MSSNVSLANAGTSLNFDGQALQNQQEAEIEREEQLQQNELRQLLSNAFDDLDDDILSVASSEEDSANSSHISAHHNSYRVMQSQEVDVEPTSDSAGGGGPLAAMTAFTSQPPPEPGPLSSHVHHSPHWTQQSASSHHTHMVAAQHSTPTEAQWEGRQGGNQWGGTDFTAGLTGTETDTEAMWSGGWTEQGGGYGQVSGGDNQSVDSGRHSSHPHNTHPGQAAPVGHYRNAPTTLASQPSSLPVFVPGSAGQYWSDTGQYGGGEDSVPSDNRHQPHPYPVYVDPTANQYTSQQAEAGPQFPANQFQFVTDQFGVSASSSPVMPHSYNTSHGEHSSDTVHPGYLAPSHPDSSQTTDPGYLSGQRPDQIQSGWNSDGIQSAGSTGVPYPDHPAIPQPGQVGEPRWGNGHHSGDSAGVGDSEVKAVGQGLAVDRPTGEGGDNYDHYTVKYRKLQPAVQSIPSAISDHKVNFISLEGDNEQATQLSQLQILYRSRGRQMEDLREELDKLTQDSAKERRMLKHLLSITTGEKEGMESSLKQCQQLLQAAKEERDKTAGQLNNSQSQVKAVAEAKEELVKKLQSAETAIENLTHQVAGLQGADSLTQARHQHEAVTSSMQQRFDTQLLDLKQQLDQANQSVTDKVEEVKRLQAQVRQQTRLAEEAQISRGETINQLTGSLEESQQRCQALLNAASSEESSKLRAQLQQSLLSKKMSDDMCNSLQTEVQELKEQLNMLESATSLGAFSATAQGSAFTDDSITDLGIRKTLDFSSPDPSTRFDGSQSAETMVTKLKRELERCVTSNRQKRTQVGELQQEIKRLQQDMMQLQQQLAEAQRTVQTQQVKVTSYEERLGGSLQPSVVESRLKRDMENMHLEKQALLKDVEEYKTRLNEVSVSEEQLTHINDQLKQQIGAMVSQHDLDKREAIERCRETCEDMHRAAREKLEHQLRSEMFADKQEVIMKYEDQLTSTREKLRDAEEEVDTVKDLYVQASQDLRHKEEALLNKDSDLEQAITAEKKKWESERDSAMETVWQQRLQKEHQAWQSERQADMEKDWHHRLELERQKWQSSSGAEKEEEWHQRLESERKQWELERQADAEKDWQQRLDTERQTWELEKKTEVAADWEQRLQQERQTWDVEKQAAWKEHLEKERRSWQVRTDREALEQADMAVEQARRQWQTETQEQLKLLTLQLEECRRQHQAELVAMETKWRQEVSEKESGLERQLEQHVQQALDTELTQQKMALLDQAQHTLHQELSKMEKRHADELQQRLREERDRVLEEARQQAEVERKAAVETAHVQWQTQLTQQQGATDCVKQEVAKWKEEAARVQGELAQHREACNDERSRLLREKDEERRQAVASVRSECQQDYQHFMEENKATLDSALDSARQRHQQELAEVEERYKKELAALRAVEQELRQAAATADSKMVAGAADGRENAGLMWQVEKLRKEMEKRDELLRGADAHMEQEVQRLKESLADSYRKQREKDNLRLQAQYSKAMQISHKERTRLERQLELHVEQLNKEKERQASPAENARLLTELQETQEERDRLQREVEEMEVARQRLQQQYEDNRHKIQQDKDRLTQRLDECQKALRALSHDKEMLVKQHDQQVAALQHRCEQSKMRVQQMEAALKAVNQQHKQDVDRLQDSLHAAHQQELAALSAQLAQAQKQHRMAMEEVQEKHRLQREALAEELEERHQTDTHKLMEEVRRQAHRALANTPTQTEADDSLCSLKDHYFTAVQKIKEEVMSHISRSNERAAVTMKAEIRLERQRTIHHLRRRCKNRLQQILCSHIERSEGQVLWTLIDQALDSLFDSVSSSCSATPNTSSAVTPRSSEEDTGRDIHDREEEGLGEGGGAVVNSSNSTAPFSTPQSVGSERYALPSALARVSLDHYQSDSSLSDPQGSGVFYSLVPDDTGSVTDSELEFKVPAPVRKTGGKRVGFHTVLAGGSGQTRRRRSTPPKGRTDLSVFVSKELPEAHDSSLLSPKLHREEREEEEFGFETQNVSGGATEDVTGWKEVEGKGWTAAVGGTNLWQAYTDLRAMEMEEKEPRRQLRFASQSFLDNYTDSDTSQASIGMPEFSVGRPQVRPKIRQSSRHTGGIVSRSAEFTHSLSVKRSPNRASLTMEERAEARGLQPHSQPHSQPSRHSSQSAHSAGSGDLSLTPHPDRHPSATVPSKLLLNPRDFLAQPAKKRSPAGQQKGGVEPETLDSMLKRLGIREGRLDSQSSSSGKRAGTSKDRKSDGRVSSVTQIAGRHPVDRPSSDQAPHPVGHKSKARTCSADDISWRQLSMGQQRKSGKGSTSALHLQQSVQVPVRRMGDSQQHRQGGQSQVVQRSLEDLPVKVAHSPLSHSTKVKSRSEQALNVLSEALNEGREEYSYTPLKHYLPAPSPSSSLLSTYSVSEGDLRHLPQQVAFDGQLF